MIRLLLIACLFAASAVSLRAQVISQVLPGGSSGATYKNDYVEIENNQPFTINLAGWSLQYGFGNSASWSARLSFPNFNLAAGQFYLVQLGTGTDASVVTPDQVTNAFTLAATAGKLALVNSSALLPVGSTGGSAGVLDLVGYGTGTLAYEGSGPAAASSLTQTISRRATAVSDTNDNALDFTATAPHLRNSANLGGPIDYAVPSVPEPSAWAAIAVGAVLLLGAVHARNFSRRPAR